MAESGEERLRTNTERRWKGALEPEVYATIVAWAFAHHGGRVQVESVARNYDDHDDSMPYRMVFEGTLAMNAQSVVCADYGTGNSHVHLWLTDGEPRAEGWLYPTDDWGDGPHSAWLNTERLADGSSRASADARLRVVGPQGEQIYTAVEPPF